MEVYLVEKLPQALQVASLFIVFFILAVFGQRKTWLSTEVIMAAALGIGFAVFPSYLLNFQIKGNVGATEVFMGRYYGMTLLSSCLTWYSTKGSLDATVPLTVMLSRLFMSSVLLMVQLCVYASTAKRTDGLQFSDQFIPAFVLPTLLWLLGNVLHLIRSSDFNTYPRHNVRVNNHLRIDAWLQLMIAVGWLAFPGQISALLWPDKKAANRIAIHIGRCIGALSIGEAITSLQAPGFLHLQDKKALFITRILMSLVQLGTGVAGFVYLGINTCQHITLLVAMTLPTLINAAIGLFTDGTVIYHVPPPSPSKEEESKTE